MKKIYAGVRQVAWRLGSNFMRKMPWAHWSMWGVCEKHSYNMVIRWRNTFMGCDMCNVRLRCLIGLVKSIITLHMNTSRPVFAGGDVLGDTVLVFVRLRIGL